MKTFDLIPSDQWPDYDLKITLKPCFRCNHKCWFCEEYDNKTKVWSKDQCDIVLDKIKQIPKEKHKIFFYFYGGEPTLSKHWEYIQYELIKTLHDRELYLQTQTNLSLSTSRLTKFLQNTTDLDHVIDICSSYHLGKQDIHEFINKLEICEKYNALGLCFFSTELPKRQQCIDEFNMLIDRFDDKIKLRFTETEALVDKNIPGYEEFIDDAYLVGNDRGKSLEFRYWLREFPEWRSHFESGWDFKVDDEVYNFSEVSGYNIHKKFRLMKCECGTKGVVIDHNLYTYHCNDDYYSNINKTHITDVNFNTYLKKNVRCLNNACYDGLDFKKYR